jgi:hypothetical protein
MFRNCDMLLNVHAVQCDVKYATKNVSEECAASMFGAETLTAKYTGI